MNLSSNDYFSTALMIMFLLIIFAVLGAGTALQSQIVPDCDLEFASQTAMLLQPYVDDPVTLSRIEAVLSSCNKSKIQKMTEISVFLFDKGVFPTKVMDDIRHLARMLAEEKKKRLEQLRTTAPPLLRKAIDEVSSVLMNTSLSGNEKLTSLAGAIAALPQGHQRSLEEFLNREAMPSQVDQKAFEVISMADSRQPRIVPIETPSFSDDLKEISRRSYPFGTDVEPIRGIGDKPSGNERNSLYSETRKNDLPLLGDLQDQSFQQKNTIGQNWFGIPPVMHDYNNPGGRLIDTMTKNHRASEESTSYKGTFNAPIRAVVSSNGRPQSVGMILRHTTPRSPIVEVDDSDLLKPGGSILSHAVDFLERAIPFVRPPPPPRFVAPSNPRYSSPYTFPFPDQIQQPSRNDVKNQIPLSESRIFLPARDALTPSAPIPVNPANNARNAMALDGYDTNLARFAGGVANSVVLPSVPALPVQGMEPNKPLHHNPLLTKSIRPQRPQYRTYPDHREGLFPETVNQAQFERPQSSNAASGSTTWTNQQYLKGKDELPTNQRTVSIENFPPAPYGISPRPKQTIGHDLLETDRLGSWPMGRFDKEEPRYPTPEPKRDTTTVIAVLQEWTTRTAPPTAATFFPEITTTPLPAFHPYFGPEQITGSHMAREVYNVRHHGKPRFVKIDLLNE